MNQLDYNHVFMTVLLFVGLILITISWNIDNNLETTNCKSTQLKTTNKLVMIIGTAFFVSALSFFGCSQRCGNVLMGCNVGVYVLFMTLLGITLIILGAIISSQSSMPGCSMADATSIWVLGIVIVLVCLFYFGNKYKHIFFDNSLHL